MTPGCVAPQPLPRLRSTPAARIVIAAVLFLASAVVLAAPQTGDTPPERINLGDSRLDGSFLKPYKNAWKIVYEFPGREPMIVGVWSDELSEIETDGRHLLKRTQMADYAKYGIVTTNINIFDPKTMAPVSMEFSRSDTGEWVHRDFHGNKMSFQRRPSKSATRMETGTVDLAQPVFDYNGGTFGVLLAALPLQAGYKAVFPSLSEDTNTLEDVTVSVGKQELVEAGPSKTVMAWPVDTEANYANKSHSIFWVTKEPPYVIKLVTFIPTARWVRVTISTL